MVSFFLAKNKKSKLKIKQIEEKFDLTSKTATFEAASPPERQT